MISPLHLFIVACCVLVASLFLGPVTCRLSPRYRNLSAYVIVASATIAATFTIAIPLGVALNWLLRMVTRNHSVSINRNYVGLGLIVIGMSLAERLPKRHADVGIWICGYGAALTSW